MLEMTAFKTFQTDPEVRKSKELQQRTSFDIIRTSK
jgi:hypothetical protein